MENLIEFFDMKAGSNRGRRLRPLTASVWYNMAYKGYNTTFSNDIVTDKAFVKIGKLGDNLCFVFNDEEGLKLSQVGSRNKNVKFSSRQFIEMIFGELEKNKDRKVFEMQKINESIYTFNPKKNK